MAAKNQSAAIRTAFENRSTSQSDTLLGVVAKKPRWYPAENLHAAYVVVQSLLEPYKQRITYGGSMGGYAAVKFSRLFGASEVISLCPQWSIDPAECDGRDPGWSNFFTHSMAGMGIRQTDISGAVFVFTDKFDKLDDFHRRMIEHVCPSATTINVPMVGHHVTSVFARTQILLRLIEACRARCILSLVTIVRTSRKDSRLRWEILVGKAFGRFPDMISRIMLKRLQKDQRALDLGAKYLFHAVDALIRRGDRRRAADYIVAFQDGLGDPRAQLMSAAVLNQLTARESRITTHLGTTLVYDFLQRISVHAAGETNEPSPVQRIVQLELVGAVASLFIDAGGFRFYLGLNASGLLISEPDCQSCEVPPRFDIRSSAGGTFTLSNAGLFLCAEPGGKIICNRDACSDWEYFRIR